MKLQEEFDLIYDNLGDREPEFYRWIKNTKRTKYNKAKTIDNSMSDWLMPWKVVDLREVVKKIGGEDWDNHPVCKEWQHQILVRSKGNDRGNLEWGGQAKETHLINKFLLDYGFKKDEMVIYWVCW